MSARHVPAKALGPLVVLAVLGALAPLSGAQSVLVRTLGDFGRDDFEITPSERYAVGRLNKAFRTEAVVIDLQNGGETSVLGSLTATGYSGPAVDAVAVTDERALVLGPTAIVIALGASGSALLADLPVGHLPRDVAITPDGTKAMVRGGSGPGGGQFAIDLASGTLLASHLGNEPPPYPAGDGYSFDVDSVDATDAHAVMTSLVLTPAPMTRVTLWDLAPAGGGPPAVAFETDATNDLLGGPYDVALTPDGTKAVVRSERRIGVYDLTLSPPAPLFAGTPSGDPGGFLEQALDAVEVTDARIVTLARVSAAQTQVEVFDMTGQQAFQRIAGSPHDLALTPDGTRALVRTSAGVFLYDLTTPLASPALVALSSAAVPAGTTAYLAGLDSVVASDRHAVTLTQVPGFAGIDIWVWDIAKGVLRLVQWQRIGNSRPTDLALTPSGDRVVVSGTNGVSVVHLASGALLFNDEVTLVNNYYPWCDGVVVSEHRAVAFGQYAAQRGWHEALDIGRLETSFCASLPNTTGVAAHVAAYGTASVSVNDLLLAIEGAPQLTFGRFFYTSSAGTPTPFGDGLLCLGGSTSFQLPVVATGIGGGAVTFPNLASPPLPGGAITPGSTWHFQFLYRNAGSGLVGFNTSDGVSITFVP